MDEDGRTRRQCLIVGLRRRRWQRADWIGGTAPREHIKTALAWAMAPRVVALPLWMVQILLIGSEMFTSATPRLDAHSRLMFLLLGVALVEAVLAIWSMVLMCNTVAEVQGYVSAWKGLGNLVLAALVFVIPLLLLVLPFLLLVQVA